MFLVVFVRKPILFCFCLLFVGVMPMKAQAVSCWTASALSYAKTVETTPGWVTVLEYHAVQDSTAHDLYIVSPENFAQQMQNLAQSNRPVLTVKQLYEALLRNDVPKGTIVITFDDGYQSVYQNAFPIMHRFRLPGTAFIIGIDTYVPTVGLKHMTLDELRRLSQAGWDIESHSFDLHPPNPVNAANAPIFVLQHDLQTENLLLLQAGNPHPVAFAYPGDFVSSSELNVVKTFYCLAFGGELPSRGPEWGSSPFNWPRIVMGNTTSMRTVLSYPSHLAYRR